MLNHVLVYTIFWGPFLIAFLDALISEQATRNRRLFLGLTALVAIIPLALFMDTRQWPWLLMIPGLAIVGYSRRMRGMGRFIISFAWISISCMAAGSLITTITSPLFRLSEMLYLPVNTFIVVGPFLIVWHLWCVVPIAFDTLRGGSWRETGVPLLSKYQIIACLLLLSLAGNALLYFQWSNDRDFLTRQASNAVTTMHSELRAADYMLANRDKITGWDERVAGSMTVFQTEARRLSGMLYKYGYPTTSAVYLLNTTLPEGMLSALERGDSLSEAESALLEATINAMLQAFEYAFYETRLSVLSKKTYNGIASQVFAILEDTDWTELFSPQYNPKFPG